MNSLTDFGKGFVVGILLAVFVFGAVFALMYFNKRDKELIEYAEKQIEIEELREDVSNRSIDDFLQMPDVRRAADGATDEFIRKRDEAVQRFRSKRTD